MEISCPASPSEPCLGGHQFGPGNGESALLTCLIPPRAPAALKAVVARTLSVCCVGLLGEEVIWMYDIGEKPGVGRYCCTNCGWSVNLDDASDRLPPCGSCGKGQQTTYNSC